MIVAVGSLNPVKVIGVKKAYEKVFRNVSVKPVKVDSGVSPQPLSLEETVKGAFNRAFKSLQEINVAEHGVGIEAGWVKVEELWLDIQVAAIVDRKGVKSLGFSPAFPLPKNVVRRVLKDNVEMEEVFEEISGIPEIGEKEGAIGFLTKSRVTRVNLTIQAVLMALIPFMPWNRKLFE